MQIQTSPQLQLLYSYARTGWAIFPVMPPVFSPDGSAKCSCGDPDCRLGAGKHPAVKWGNITKATPPGQIREWLRRNPAFNWAMVLGPSKICVLDVDPRNGGDESLTRLEAEHGPLPVTATVLTGGGGQHRYFLATPEISTLASKTAVQLAPGLEWLSGKHIILMPPSLHKSGRRYEWMEGPTNGKPAPIAEIVPDWLAASILEKNGPRPAAVTVPAASTPRPTAPSLGPAADPIGRARRYAAKLEPAVQGQNGSRRLKHAACILLIGFDLGRADAKGLLMEYSDRCSPPWSDAELEHVLDTAEKEPGPRGTLLNAERPDRGFTSRFADELRGTEHIGPEVFREAMQQLIEWRAAAGRMGTDGAAAAVSRSAPSSLDLSDLDATVTPADLADRAAEEELRRRADLLINEARRAALLSAPPCDRPHGLFLDHNFKPQSLLMTMRCESPWSSCECHGCRTYRTNEWIANVRIRLAEDDDGPDHPFYVLTCTDLEWHSRVKHRCHRACKAAPGSPPDALPAGGWIRIAAGLSWMVICSRPIKGARPIAPVDAISQLVTALNAFSGHFRPVYANARWDLPQEPKKPSQCTVRGRIPHDSMRAVDAVLDAEPGLVVKDIQVSKPRARRISRMRVLLWPKHWARWGAKGEQCDREEHLYYKLLHAEPDIPFVSSRPTEEWKGDGDGDGGWPPTGGFAPAVFASFVDGRWGVDIGDINEGPARSYPRNATATL